MTKSEKKESYFNYRVGGIIIKNGKILLHSDPHVEFWVVPGGSAKPFEASDKAVIREFQEEIGLSVTVERLLFIIENSFEFSNTKFHGLELMFLVTPNDTTKILEQEEFIGIETDHGDDYYGEGDLTLTYRWFAPSELDSIVIEPQVLKEALKNIPNHPVLLRNLEIDYD